MPGPTRYTYVDGLDDLARGVAGALVACGLTPPAAVFVTDDVVLFTMTAVVAEQVDQDDHDVERAFGVPQPTSDIVRRAVTPAAPDEIFAWQAKPDTTKPITKTTTG